MDTSAPKAKRQGTRYCCVVGCHNSVLNTKGKEPPVKFYAFPGKWFETDRREAWIRAVRRTNPDGSPWLPKKDSRICSRHFVNNAKSESQANPAYLPTLFPDAYKRRRVSGERHERWAKRSRSAARSLTPPHPPEGSSPVDVLSNVSANESSPDTNAAALEGGLLLLAEVAVDAQQLPLTCVAETQTDPVYCKGPLQLMLSATDGTHGSTQVTHIAQADKVTHPEKTWARRCGFLGYESLKSSEQALQDLCGVTMTVFSILLNLLPDQRYRSSDVTKEDKLVLFLMKLKLGVSLTALGAIFGISKSTASRVFRLTLDCLSVKLRKWVFVPPRCAIKDTLPECFVQHYPQCTFIIDCTEIRTETPTDPEAQHYLYSNYKGSYTLKFLIAILPNGMVSFISKVYGGRHSDSFITRDSGFLSLIEPGDVVLCDKGFPAIKTTMADEGAVLVMPPFNVGGGQLSKENMETTLIIAQVRIHVERAIQRLKLHNVLTNRVPLTLVPQMEKVMQVCSALVNMQSPIIKF